MATFLSFSYSSRVHHVHHLNNLYPCFNFFWQFENIKKLKSWTISKFNSLPTLFINHVQIDISFITALNYKVFFFFFKFVVCNQTGNHQPKKKRKRKKTKPNLAIGCYIWKYKILRMLLYFWLLAGTTCRTLMILHYYFWNPAN